MTIIGRLSGSNASEAFTINRQPNDSIRLESDANRLSIRNADDTADAGLICGQIISSSTIAGTAFLGNATTATTLQTPRNISGVAFNGSANITLSTTGITEGTNLYYTDVRARTSISPTSFFNYSNGVLDLANTGVTPGSYTNPSITVNSKGQITLASNATEFLGNAATASVLQTPRNISGVAFDGSANITLSTSGITEGTNLYYTDARARAAVPLASSSASGTVKVNGVSADPVTYLASEIDTFLATKANASDLANYVTNSILAATLPSYALNTSLDNHTGNTSNPHSTTAAQVGAIATSSRGAASGVASLDENSLVPVAQIPAAIARLSVAQSFSARQSSSPVVANISGSYTLDLSLSNTFDLTLTGNTSLSVSNLPSQITGYTMILRQDATGGRTVTFNSIFQVAKGKIISLPGTLANEENIFSIIADGTRLCVLGWDAWV